MRILHLSNHIRNSGNGIVNVLVDLACSQSQIDGCKVAVASSGGEYEDLLHDHGVEHFALSLRKRPEVLARAAFVYRRIIRKFRPDIVHAHMMTVALLGYFLRFRSRYTLVTTVHNEFQRSAVLMGFGDCVVAVSDAVSKSMKERGISNKKLRTVHNGPLGSPRYRLSFDDDAVLRRPAVLTVAGMYVRKGIMQLLQAFSRVLKEHPQAHLYLVGDGPDRARFESYAGVLGVSEHVHFEGFQAQPTRYMRSADIFVLASLNEPFALVLAEARQAGLAIVASRVGGTPEALDGGEAGILVPPNDLDALTAAMLSLMNDAAELCRWRERAVKNTEWLSVARMNQDTMNVYREFHLTS